MMGNTTQCFYADLPAVGGFESVTDTKLYRPFPADWSIVIADVRNSTRAIEEERYKDVNLIGASCIIAALNACKGVEIAFVFGGDGAALVVPPTVVDAVSQTTRATVNLARDQFGMDLRAGVVPVSKVLSLGASLSVGKFQMSPHLTQAMFMGDGLTCAEKLIKDPAQSDTFNLQPDASAEADFSGLECRWKNVPSSAGETHSIIIQATEASDIRNQQTYEEVLIKIHEIYGPEADHHPIPLGRLELSLSPQTLAGEARVHHTPIARLLLANLIGKILFVKKSKTFGIDWNRYRKDVRVNSDFRKFDGMLRMVIGGNRAQREKFEEYLQSRRQEGSLTYGLHHSTHALMTCLVFSREGNHLHFVDGGDGGYALAALQIKQHARSSG